MRRRECIALIGSAFAWPFGTRAQQPKTPVIGFLHAGSSGPVAPYMAEFRLALAEAGYVENQNVTIVSRYAEGQYNRLVEMAADLVRRQVSVIVTAPSATNCDINARLATESAVLVRHFIRNADGRQPH